MSLLYRVIYAAHANGSHHKLALDALLRLTRADAEAWTRVFLKHAKLYMDGSKAPDNEFKDFKNHVLHVEDGYWGGAPEACERWYANLVTALKEQNWSEAVWCAGVLSHYVVDPIHPFHTGQTEAENNVHRAVEWSINRGYDDLKREGEIAMRGELLAAPSGPNWLRDHVCRGAEVSHRYYGTLIAHYDINVGVVDPPAGLDSVARAAVGELIVYAADSFARVLERAIDEADVTPPDVSLALDTLLATLAMPKKWIAKRLANAEDRRIVEAMYDELMATGRVEQNLPEDDRMVRDLHAREVLAPRKAKQAVKRDERMVATPRAVKAATPVAPAASAADASIASDVRLAPPKAGAVQQDATAPAEPAATAPLPATAVFTSVPVTRPVSDTQRFAAALDPATPSAPRVTPLTERLASLTPKPAVAPRPASGNRRQLQLADDVEAAPAIGPRMAERLAASCNVRTIGDLLAADAAGIAASLGVRHVSAATVAHWQNATRLIMALPIVNGTQAQLLAGAGFATTDAIADADPIDLCAALLQYAQTSEGTRLLRDGAAPDIERVKLWVEGARANRAA